MNDYAPSIADVLNFVNSFYEQCRNMVQDAVRIFRDTHGIYLTHYKRLDCTTRPRERFLEQEYGCVRRAWLTYLPPADVQRGAMFCFDFFHPHRRITPSLIYGAVHPGSVSFESLDRWAAFYTIDDAEKGQSNATVSQDGPIAVVSGIAPRHFQESTLVRVPLETIRDQAALERIVVCPLAALLRNARSEATTLLAGVTAEPWPMLQAEVASETDVDSEEA